MKTSKIVFSIVLLAAAVVIAWVYGLGGEATPDTPDTATSWMCEGCSHTFKLTAKEQFDLAKQEPQPWPPALCPKCGEKKAYPAQQCTTCQTWFFGSEVPGWFGACPKCYPERKAVEDEEESPDKPVRREAPVKAL